MKEEYETSYHLMILAVFSILGILLITVNVISGWSVVAVPVIVLLLGSVWGIHFLKFGKSKTRVYIYIILILGVLFYYGYHTETVTDIPMILALLIIVLIGQHDMHLIYLVAFSYFLMLAENIFITGFLGPDMSQLTASRTALGMIIIICSIMVARFFIRMDLRDKDSIEILQEQLYQAKGENEQYLSNISHELRTPINAVNGMSEILLHRNLDEEMAAQIQVIQDAGKRLYRQVSDMIDFSELQTGHFVLQYENYEPLSVINDAISAVFGREMTKKLDFAIDVNPYFNYAKYTRPVIGEYYSRMLNHVRIGLKMDIRETTSLKELKKNVEKGGYSHVFVARWEYEMEPDFFARLSRKCHVVIFTDHRLSMPSDSRIRQMIKPIYLLTVVNYLKESMTGEREDENEETEWKGYRPPRSLIVDDDEMNIIVANGILKNLGVETESCTGGEVAIGLCKEREYDIIFMDYMMPGMNGTDAMKKIRELKDGYYKKIPIIVLTANAVSSARAGFLLDGFDEFISKPIEIPVMKKVLRTFLEGSASDRIYSHDKGSLSEEGRE